ncbi:hypothetical protein GUI12_04600 [Anaplasmataceae bacterium AB001_6]|nr:hypothetical protein GUI12_04600 [Anaplasmataceae bacterium AB001_6]
MLQNIEKELENFDMLKHEFYQLWNDGKLDINVIKDYTCQYYEHIKNFPNYIKKALLMSKSDEERDVLQRNLDDEITHPELWVRFANGIGITREKIENAKMSTEGSNLHKSFDSQKSYEENIGALFAYERQFADISKAKLESSKKHYKIKEVEFFEVHAVSDIWHTEELIQLIRKMSSEQLKKVKEGALAVAEAFYKFLDQMLLVQQKQTINQNF